MVGLITAAYFGTEGGTKTPHLLQDFDFDSQVNQIYDGFMDNLPAGLAGFLNEAKNTKKDVGTSEAFSVGIFAKQKGFKSKHPVILVPGVISTGLESWDPVGTDECPGREHFRKRLWGSFYMLKAMFFDKKCWLKHIMLDTETGLDPVGVKIRAAQGFEAADFFITGYWIWNKILENLSVIGYDPNNMVSASYDWRLSYLDLERRDSYFSKLKKGIETMVETNGEKALLIGHSMGSQVIFYFLKWVEAEGKHFGNGGKGWVDKYIDSYVDVSGSTLGTPKAIVALLSGEMKDTVQLNTVAVYGLEKFFSKKERATMLRSFGGIASMLPKGGDKIWGSLTSAPDDPYSKRNPQKTITDNVTYGNFLRFRNTIGEHSDQNYTMAESVEFLLDQASSWFKERTNLHYSYGLAETKEELIENNDKFNKWSNPLEVGLPNAPNMKIYCFYGIGNPTERSYYYKEEINKEYTQLNISMAGGGIQDPVVFSEGDGTVSILTHSMCHIWAKGKSSFNPGGSEVKIVEMMHEPDKFDIRGGAKTAEHVDILGSTELNELVLTVASGNGDLIKPRILSNMTQWVDNMNILLS